MTSRFEFHQMGISDDLMGVGRVLKEESPYYFFIGHFFNELGEKLYEICNKIQDADCGRIEIDNKEFQKEILCQLKERLDYLINSIDNQTEAEERINEPKKEVL